MTLLNKFEANNIYEMRFIGDSELKVPMICIKVTEKTASFQYYKKINQGTITKKIKNNNGNEYVLTASYSMAPVINSKNLIV